MKIKKVAHEQKIIKSCSIADLQQRITCSI